jgi:hypothetical protein
LFHPRVEDDNAHVEDEHPTHPLQGNSLVVYVAQRVLETFSRKGTTRKYPSVHRCRHRGHWQTDTQAAMIAILFNVHACIHQCMHHDMQTED